MQSVPVWRMISRVTAAGYSAQPLYTSSLIATFNVVWTSWPTIGFAVLEQVSQSTPHHHSCHAPCSTVHLSPVAYRWCKLCLYCNKQVHPLIHASIIQAIKKPKKEPISQSQSNQYQHFHIDIWCWFSNCVQSPSGCSKAVSSLLLYLSLDASVNT